MLDGYGRSGILREIYGYENSEFINGLCERGFFIAERARSNYTQTGLSLASSLNLSYLDFLGEDPGLNTDDRTPIARLIRHSRLRTFLEDLGYDIVGLSSGYCATEIEDPDSSLFTGAFAEATRVSGLLVPTYNRPHFGVSAGEV